MRILITRPIVDARQTAHDLAVHDIDTVIAPLFELEYLTPAIPEQNYQAAIFTSRHSARHFVQQYTPQSIPAFCVGNETAAILHETGFHPVYSADADAIALHHMITEHITDKSRPILRLHAALEHDPLYDWLIADGFNITRAALYRTNPVLTLPDAAIDALKNGTVNGVCLYSPNAARHFTTLIRDAGLSDTCRHMTAWCISENTKAALDLLSFGHISVSDHPSHHAMVRLMSKNCEKDR